MPAILPSRAFTDRPRCAYFPFWPCRGALRSGCLFTLRRHRGEMRLCGRESTLNASGARYAWPPEIPTSGRACQAHGFAFIGDVLTIRGSNCRRPAVQHARRSGVPKLSGTCGRLLPSTSEIVRAGRCDVHQPAAVTIAYCPRRRAAIYLPGFRSGSTFVNRGLDAPPLLLLFHLASPSLPFIMLTSALYAVFLGRDPTRPSLRSATSTTLLDSQNSISASFCLVRSMLRVTKIRRADLGDHAARLAAWSVGPRASPCVLQPVRPWPQHDWASLRKGSAPRVIEPELVFELVVCARSPTLRRPPHQGVGATRWPAGRRVVLRRGAREIPVRTVPDGRARRLAASVWLA